MKKVLYVAMLIACSNSYGQNTFPVTGPVGIYTTAPSAGLDVNSRMIVDSSLLVKDSVTIQKDLRVKGKITGQDQVRFMEEVAMEQVVKMTGLAGLNNVNNPNLEFLIKTPSGEVKTFGVGDLLNIILSNITKFEDDLPLDPILCVGNVIQHPIWRSGPNKLYVYCPQVFVGIGTNNPAYKLDVRDLAYLQRLKVGAADANHDGMINGFDITSSRDLIQLGVKNQSTQNQSQVRFKVNHDGATTISNKGSGASLVVNNGTGNAIVIYDNNGTKIFQLQNNGLLRAREIRVDAANWADFVFNEGYKLISLEELEKYIAKHHHLPDMPSEKEVKEEGINVAEMQALQLQKMEEMTLYMIEMNKQMKQMQEQISDLQIENEQLKSNLGK